LVKEAAACLALRGLVRVALRAHVIDIIHTRRNGVNVALITTLVSCIQRCHLLLIDTNHLRQLAALALLVVADGITLQWTTIPIMHDITASELLILSSRHTGRTILAASLLLARV
jgi:hypothetical protein